MALVLPAAQSAPICRWVDDAGRVQFANTAPGRYQAVATCMDSLRYGLSAAQRQTAGQRADADGAGARPAAVVLPLASTSDPSRLARAAPRPVAKHPTEVVTNATDCPTWWRLFDESVDCFGPYRTTRGAVKAAAFGVCNVIASPEPACGPRGE